MKIVNIHAAKTNLSRLVAEAEAGDAFVIARAGVPVVRVEAIREGEGPLSRLDMLKGRIAVPEDFDRGAPDREGDRGTGPDGGCGEGSDDGPGGARGEGGRA